MPTAVVAPSAPGRLGDPVEPAAMLRYLEELAGWRERRRAELDEIDRHVAGSPDAAALTGDVTLAMALWQSVAARHDELLALWDDGRAGPVERRRLAAAVWGRRTTAAGPDGASALAVSLPEACRLSDALAAQLRLRVALDPLAPDVAERLRDLRAAAERVRELTEDEPAGILGSVVEEHARLARRVADVVERAGRGADVTGPLRSVEVALAQLERDLIVSAGRRRAAARDSARATALREALAARQQEASRIEAACVAAVASPPRLAVPRVEQLGPVPDEPSQLPAYLARLEAVERALAHVHAAYSAPLQELADLRAAVAAYDVKAADGALANRVEVHDLGRHVRVLLSDEPVDLARARTAVAAYRLLVSGDRPTTGGAP